ncbi:transposable element Tcb1 transposase [Trichonephila clavipes]|nr:transposable element Tcb1 transposase [Trichonephila clavipes]
MGSRHRHAHDSFAIKVVSPRRWQCSTKANLPTLQFYGHWKRVKDLLHTSFGECRMLSCHFCHVWPSRSPNLNPCDYWSWSNMKLQVYHDRLPSLGMIKDHIRWQILTISTDILYNAVLNIVLLTTGIVDE